MIAVRFILSYVFFLLVFAVCANSCAKRLKFNCCRHFLLFYCFFVIICYFFFFSTYIFLSLFLLVFAFYFLHFPYFPLLKKKQNKFWSPSLIFFIFCYFLYCLRLLVLISYFLFFSVFEKKCTFFVMFSRIFHSLFSSLKFSHFL